jgi:two-component system response regulator DctR
VNQEEIRVVVIEDDPMVQEINKNFIERVPFFRVVGMAANGAEGVSLVSRLQPDLVVMDVFMPVLDGVQTLTQMRAADEAVDVIVITAAKDKPTIQNMLRYGAMDYIIKPFQFERIQQSLENYRNFRNQLNQAEIASQQEVDQLLFSKAAGPGKRRELSKEALPKGLHAVTLDQIVRQLAVQTEPLSAEDVAERVGIARVTARRYLDYLVKTGRVQLDVTYGGIGRPTNRYALVSPK